jgi:glutamine---fructose-6-phosphate transaminase (isomerizing)
MIFFWNDQKEFEMGPSGQLTYAEIQSQPQAWADALKILQAQQGELTSLVMREPYDRVIFTGCGSTYYTAIAAAALYRELSGKNAYAFPASELWLFPQSSYPRAGKTLLVAISRSGATSETIRACEAFRSAGRGQVLTITCYAEEKLAGLGDLNILLPSGQEESIAQTRAFSTLYLGCVAFAALSAGRTDVFAAMAKLPALGEAVIRAVGPLAKAFGQDEKLDRFYFLGSGARYGLACEVSLKMKEMSLSHSEPFHFMEFRHGPKSMVTAGTLLVGMYSEGNQGTEQVVLQEMIAMGARTLTSGEEHADVIFHSGVDEVLRSVLHLPLGQLLAFEHSIAKGLNPDRPENLTAVVRLE